MKPENYPVPVEDNKEYPWKWQHNNTPVNDFTLRKYSIYQHVDGRWSQPKDDGDDKQYNY